MKLLFTPQTLRFKRSFSIAHGSRDSTPVVFVRLEHLGIFGYGEASMPPYLGETHKTVIDFLQKAQTVLSAWNPGPDTFHISNVTSILSKIDAIASDNTAAKASVDMALYDLLGKFQNIPCHKILGADAGKELFTAYTIPMDDPAGLQSRIEEAKEYKILKVKLGSAEDKKTIQQIRGHTDKAIFVDVNEGWTDKYFALDRIQWLADRNVLLVEQPLPKEHPEDIAWLTSKSPIPILADEGVQRLQDIEKIKGVYTGINIKLMKCTGLHEAMSMIQEVRKIGMKIMLGCMSESSCGVSAAAQIAPLVDWVDLDGPLLIKNDFFDGVKFSEGRIYLNNKAGIGVTPLVNLF